MEEEEEEEEEEGEEEESDEGGVEELPDFSQPPPQLFGDPVLGDQDVQGGLFGAGGEPRPLFGAGEVRPPFGAGEVNQIFGAGEEFGAGEARGQLAGGDAGRPVGRGSIRDRLGSQAQPSTVDESVFSKPRIVRGALFPEGRAGEQEGARGEEEEQALSSETESEVSEGGGSKRGECLVTYN